jgi:peptide/nickel transport system substrate-binding protein
MAIYDELIHIDPTTHEITPGLAASVTGNADATVWTIKLRPNLEFSDGTPLDAAAVKANWDRLADPATASPARTVVTGMTSYVVVDPRRSRSRSRKGSVRSTIYLVAVVVRPASTGRWV